PPLWARDAAHPRGESAERYWAAARGRRAYRLGIIGSRPGRVVMLGKDKDQLSAFQESEVSGSGDRLVACGGAQLAVDRDGLAFDGVSGQEQFLADLRE